MPYNSIDELPDRIKKVLPKSGQRIFMEVFNKAYEDSNGDEVYAFKVAWSVIKKKFKKKGDKWVAKSSDFEIKSNVYLKFDDMEFYLDKTNSDDVIVEAVLTSTAVDGHGHQVTKLALSHFADQINKYGLKGKFDNHKVLDLLLKKGYDSDKIEYILRNFNADVEIIKAFIEDNKLKGILKIKKKYLPLLKRYNGISLEYRIPEHLFRDGKIYGGRVLSFTLTDNPANPDSRIAM